MPTYFSNLLRRVVIFKNEINISMIIFIHIIYYREKTAKHKSK